MRYVKHNIKIYGYTECPVDMRCMRCYEYVTTPPLMKRRPKKFCFVGRCVIDW